MRSGNWSELTGHRIGSAGFRGHGQTQTATHGLLLATSVPRAEN